MESTVDPPGPHTIKAEHPGAEHTDGAELPLLRLGTVTSTQDEATLRLREGQPLPFVLTARRQTSGRGRLGRAFASPAGASLSFTYAHRTGLDPADRGWIPLAAGLAMVSTLSQELGLRAGDQIGLKWPNDLHTHDGRKLGGILVEGRGADVVLVGIGLNLRGPVRQSDGSVVPGAAWLRGDGGLLPEAVRGLPDERLRERLETVLATILAGELARLESAGGDGVSAGTHDRYTMTCLTLGRRVRVDPLGEQSDGGAHPRSWSGVSRAIDGHGRLVVDLAGGGQAAVDVGDVRHLRPEAPAHATADEVEDIEQEEHVT